MHTHIEHREGQRETHKRSRPQLQKITFWAVLSVIVVAAFFGGIFVGSGQSVKADASTIVNAVSPNTQAVKGVDLSEFWRVWHLMDEKFANATSSERISNEDRVRGAIKGMVGSFGDDYTVYMPPTESESFHTEMSGEFSGVGMEVGLRDGVVTVITPIEGTPAMKAGMRAGDKILEINGTSTKDMSVDKAVQLIRGPKGTEVTLKVYSDGAADTKKVKITRDTIVVPTAKTETHEDVFVIKLYTFNDVAEREFISALQKYAESGKKKLIIDLRGNPGGYMQTAINIAGFFVPKGEVVLRERDGAEHNEVVYRSVGYELGDAKPKKMVVLIDKGSASASEILAGALHDNGIATLIGETSFGKGTVQELVDLPSKASLKVTIARWFTPQGVNITKTGLTPDIEVKRTADDITKQKDPQLERALRFFRTGN